MNALGAVILVATLAAIWFGSRRVALLGILAGVLYLTQEQQLVVAGINMYAMRFVELVAFVRVARKREFQRSEITRLDKIFVFLYLYTTIVFLLRSANGQAYQIGLMVDAFLCYFAFRGLIKNVEDFREFLRDFTLLLIPFVIAVMIESITSETPFLILGKTALRGEEWFRGTRLRCEGSFRHPSLLGTLGASFLIIYLGLWVSKLDRKWAYGGIMLSALIVYASNSGGPLNFTAVGMVGWSLWVMRTRMKAVRWAILFLVIGLTLSMKAPIWYLLAKVSTISGGDGWHRSYLMDMAYQNLDKWWFAGMSILETTDWFPYNLEATGGADMTNTFLGFGITAGLVSMVFYVALLVYAFKELGRSLWIVRLSGVSSETESLLWGLGAALVGHIINWLGIIYFDQTYVIWFLQLAIISTLTQRCAEFARNPEIAVEGLDEGEISSPDLTSQRCLLSTCSSFLLVGKKL